MPFIFQAEKTSTLEMFFQSKVFKRQGMYYLIYVDTFSSGAITKFVYRKALNISDLATASVQTILQSPTDFAHVGAQRYGKHYDTYYNSATDLLGIAWIDVNSDILRFVTANFDTGGNLVLNAKHQISNTVTDINYPILHCTTSGKWGVATMDHAAVSHYNYRLWYCNTPTPTSQSNWNFANPYTNPTPNPQCTHRICSVGTNSNDKFIFIYARGSSNNSYSKLWSGSSFGSEVATGAQIGSASAQSNMVMTSDGDAHMIAKDEGSSDRRHFIYDESAGTWTVNTVASMADINNPSLHADSDDVLHAVFFGGSPSIIRYYKYESSTWTDETSTLTGDLAIDWSKVSPTPTTSRDGCDLLIAWRTYDDIKNYMDHIVVCEEGPQPGQPNIEEVDKIDGECWELGVALPFGNMALDKYEKNFKLVTQANIDVNVLSLDYDLFVRRAIKSGMKVYIGPSSNTDKNASGEFIHYGKTMDATITKTIYNGTTGKVAISIDILTNAIYEVGDNITIRGLGLGWDILQQKHFPGESHTYLPGRTEVEDTIGGQSYFPKRYSSGSEGDGINNNEDYIYDRIDPMFERRGYSQQMKIENSNYDETTLDVDRRIGIIQLLNKDRATYLMKMRGKNIRVSCWHRYRAQGLDKDALQIGFIEYDKIFLEQSGIAITQKSEFETALPKIYSTADRWIQGTVTIDNSSLLGGLYCYIDTTGKIEQAEVRIDDITAEHALNTTQEDNGFYTFPKLPQVGGLDIKTSPLPKTEQLTSGLSEALYVKDSIERFTIIAKYERVSIDFIEDMLTFQEYCNRGHVLILRTFMFDTIPPVIFCKIKVGKHTTRDERNYDMYDVRIIFEEVVL